MLFWLFNVGNIVLASTVGTNNGKGNGGGLVVPLLNIAMPLATVGAVGIAIAAVLRDATVHVTVFVLSNLLYS